MKNKKQLTREQRYETEVLLRTGKRQKETAEPVEKDKSVISRELKRNSHKRGCSARPEQEYADERRERFRRKRRFTDSIHRKAVKEPTQEQWSPEQIAGRARRDGLPVVSTSVSVSLSGKIKRKVERSVNISGTGSNTESDLWAGRRQSYPIKYPLICVPISSVKKNVSETGKLILLLALKNKGAILTATERTTGFLLMKKLPKGKNAKALAKELFFLLLPYKQCVHSITSDDGSEFYGHKLIAKYPDANCFFCSPIFVMGKRTE